MRGVRQGVPMEESPEGTLLGRAQGRETVPVQDVREDVWAQEQHAEAHEETRGRAELELES